MAIVVGARSGTPAPKLSKALTAMARDTVEAGRKVFVIRLDGSPAVVFDDDLNSTASNGPAFERDVNRHMESIARAFREKATAARPEADVLAAIGIAARSVGEGGNVVVLDSALATKGDLNFRQDGMLSADPVEVAESLKRNDALPGLAGRRVLFEGLGNTVEPQPPLGERGVKNLGLIWAQVAKAAGAACTFVNATPSSRMALRGTPPVTVVPVPPPVPSIKACGDTKLTEAHSVGFVRGEAEFREPGAARKTLGRLAEVLAGSGKRVELIGTTSSEGDRQYNLRLSRARAEKVRDTLVELGIPGDRVTARGVGTDWPDNVQDVTAGGAVIPAAAARNRKVIVRLPACPA